MIFPDLPKHYSWQQTQPKLEQNTLSEVHTVQANTGPKAPLRGFADMTIDEWFDQHGYSVGPAAASERTTIEPINWLAPDAIEFYVLCLAMICWFVYWYGAHIGSW
jgi:hypothetical protein